MFRPTADGQDINMSFLGSKGQRYPERMKYLNYLEDNNIDILVAGGQRDGRLTPQKYADLIRRSKITINFPRACFGDDQLKGRVLEAMASKSLVFERKNKIISTIFEPGVHYVEYTSPQDLVEKYNYYLENEEERKQIAHLY